MRLLSLLGVFCLGCTFVYDSWNRSGGGYSGGGGGGGYNQNIVGEYEPWGSAGRPAYGDYPNPGDIASAFIGPSSWRQATYDFGIAPHDPWAPSAGQSFVYETQLVDVYLDRDADPEKVIIVRTHSGEYFLVAFAPTDDNRTWHYLGTYPLPSIARDAKCRADGDGLFRAQGANMVKYAPQFLWIEMQVSDKCSETQYTERSLHLYALIEGHFGPIFEAPVVRAQYLDGGQKIGEQLNYTIKLDQKKGGLLLSGPREIYAEGGMGQPEIYNTDLWYYFDGRAYRSQGGNRY